MAAGVFRPPTFKPNEARLCGDWRDFKADLGYYFIAADLQDADDKRKIAILLYSMYSSI